MLKLAVHNVAPTEVALVQLCCKTPGQQTLTTTLLSEMVDCAKAALEVILLIQTADQDQFWLLKEELAFTTTSKHNHNLIILLHAARLGTRSSPAAPWTATLLVPCKLSRSW